MKHVRTAKPIQANNLSVAQGECKSNIPEFNYNTDSDNQLAVEPRILQSIRYQPVLFDARLGPNFYQNTPSDYGNS